MYPSTTLAEFDQAQREIHQGTCFLDFRNVDNIAVIDLGRCCKVPDILPVAFYRSGLIPLVHEAAFESNEFELLTYLSQSDLCILLKGREVLKTRKHEAMQVFLEAITRKRPAKCTMEGKCHAALEQSKMVLLSTKAGLFSTSDPLVPFISALRKQVTLCKQCEKEMMTQYNKAREAAWAWLGAIFDLEDHWPPAKPQP